MRLASKVTLYYVTFGIISAAVISLFPDLADLVSGGGAIATGLLNGVPAETPTYDWETAASLLASMVVAVLLMVPVTWVYMGNRQDRGYDKSVVRTIVLLPIAVAGVVILVQNSVALAFSLAGIVAAVRFRTTLKDKSDALFVFVSIGVGLAAGIGAMPIAAVLTVVFTYLSMWLQRMNFGDDGGLYEHRRAEQWALKRGALDGRMKGQTGFNFESLSNGSSDPTQRPPQPGTGFKVDGR